MARDFNIIFNQPNTRSHWIRRGLAYIIDLLVIFGIIILGIVIAIMLSVAFGLAAVGGISPMAMSMVIGAYLIMIILIAFITILICIAYFVIMDVKYQGTIGKKFMGIEVEKIEGETDLSAAIIRNISKIAGIFIGLLLLNYLFMVIITTVFVAIDLFFGLGESEDPRQKYTDIMAGTTVVRTDIDETLEDLKYVPPPEEVIEKPPVEPKPVDVTTERTDIEAASGLKETEKDIIQKYMRVFKINEERALNLYQAGYRSMDDFKDAIPEDLIIIDKINPTTARRIMKRVNE